VASVKATVLQYAGIGKIDSGSECTVSGYVSTEYADSSSNTLLKAGFKVEIQGAGSTLTDEKTAISCYQMLRPIPTIPLR
jgi:hypothetical protein